MRAGLFLAYWPWFTPQEQVDLAVLADELGLDSVWISEAWGQDAVSVLGLLAGKTERVALGSGLFQIPARAPAATAMAAATLDVLSDGRFRLGLGVSGPQVSEGWYGVPFERPVRRTREYVEIVRAALARKTVVHEGREYRVPLEGAKPLKLLAKPVQQRIPVYLGAVGPKAVEQVGEIADGWLPFMVSPEHASTLFEPLDRGLAEGGPHACGPRRRGLHGDGGRGRPRRGARRRGPWAASSSSVRWSGSSCFSTSSSPMGRAHGAAAREAPRRRLAGDRAGAVVLGHRGRADRARWRWPRYAGGAARSDLPCSRLWACRCRSWCRAAPICAGAVRTGLAEALLAEGVPMGAALNGIPCSVFCGARPWRDHNAVLLRAAPARARGARRLFGEVFAPGRRCPLLVRAARTAPGRFLAPTLGRGDLGTRSPASSAPVDGRADRGRRLGATTTPGPLMLLLQLSFAVKGLRLAGARDLLAELPSGWACSYPAHRGPDRAAEPAGPAGAAVDDWCCYRRGWQGARRCAGRAALAFAGAAVLVLVFVSVEDR